ncbi:MAG: membrane protein insertase YidC [Clostridia bacterium]|nr:membrane protein insertase YidC [Clostridia bacterium]
MFAAIGNFLYGVLAGINNLVQNYGISIILFTILIRLICLPFDYKSRKGMRKMSLIQPKLNELQRKYGNDKQKYQQKQAELMRKEGYNPLSSCLPLLLTWPLMIAMFSAMRSIANEQTAMQTLRFLVDGQNAIRPEEQFLWVKNIWMTDSPFTSIAPSLKYLAESERMGLGMDVWAKAFGNLSNEEILAVVRQMGLSLDKLIVIPLDDMGNALLNAETFFQLPADSMLATLQEANLQLGAMITGNSLMASGFNMTDLCAQLALVPEYKAAIEMVGGWEDINLWITHLSLYKNYNGLLLFPILAGVSQILQTKLNPQMKEQQATQPANGQSQGMSNFMKYFFPILSIWFCLTSNAGFSVYWVTSTVVMWVQSILITKYLERKDAQSTEKVIGEGSIK